MIETIKSLKRNIQKYFNPIDVHIQEIPPTEEGENPLIWILIIVDEPVEKGLNQLEKFDKNFWCKQPDHIREGVCIDVGFYD